MNIRKLIEQGNMGLGWAALWRISLILLPLNLAARFAAEEAATNPVAGAALLLALPVGGNMYLVPVAVPLVLFLWNWVGKYVLRTKLGFTTDRFIGWAVYWRICLLQLAGIAVLSLLMIPATLLARSAGDRTQLIVMGATGLVLLPALVYWSLNVVGYVLRRISVLMPGEAEMTRNIAAAGGVRVRDHATLFNRSEYGTNWLLAGAYVATGLVSTVTYPVMQALFGAGFSYGMGEVLPVYLASWAIAGAGLTLILHHLRSAWQVAVVFVVLMVLLRILEGGLMGLLESGPGLQVMEPSGLSLRAVYSLLFALGLLGGIRLLGPTITGFAVGTGLAGWVHIALVYPLLAHWLRDVPLDSVWNAQRFAMDTLTTAVDALITGFVFWWVCDRHLQRRGLRLTRQGVIEPLASGSPAASPGLRPEPR